MPLVICHPTKTIKLQGAADSGRVTCDREVEGWRARPVGGALLKNLLTGPNMETSSPTRSHPSWPKSMSFSQIDCVAVAVDPMRRNFELMRKQAKSWQRLELTDVTVKQGKGVRKS